MICVATSYFLLQQRHQEFLLLEKDPKKDKAPLYLLKTDNVCIFMKDTSSAEKDTAGQQINVVSQNNTDKNYVFFKEHKNF